MTLLQLQDIGMAYHTLNGEIPALFSYQFHKRRRICLSGRPGGWKKYHFESDRRSVKTKTGAITMQGIPLEKSPVTIGYMLQKDHLFEWRTIYENVILGLEIQKKLTKDRLDRVEELLKGLWAGGF